MGNLEDIANRNDVPEDVKHLIDSLLFTKDDYHSLLENLPAVIWKTDAQGNTTYISPNVNEIYGFSQNEIYQGGENLWFGRIHPEDVERVKQAFTRLLSKGNQFNIEYRIQRKDGQWICLEDRAIAVYEQKTMKYAYGFFVDITQRKEVALALQESEAKFHSFFRDAPFPIAEFDLSGIKKILTEKKIENLQDYLIENPKMVDTFAKITKLKECNKAFFSLFEFKQIDEFSLEMTKTEKSEEDVLIKFPILRGSILSFYSRNKSFEDEVTLFSKKGRKISAIIKCSMVPGFEQDWSKILVSIIDITKIKKVEEALKKSQAKFNQLFMKTPIPVRELDLSECLVFLNDLKTVGVHDFEEYFKLNPKEVRKLAELVKDVNMNEAALNLYNVRTLDEYLTIRMEIWDSRNEETNFEVIKNYLRLLSGEKVLEIPLIQTIEGKEVYNLVRAIDVSADQKPLSQILVATDDVTKIREAEKALKKSEISFRQLFEEAPVPLRELDLSKSFSYFKQLERTGITDFEEFFGKNPHELDKLLDLAEIVNINSAALEIFGSEKTESNLARNIDVRTLITDLIKLFKGYTTIERETTFIDAQGRETHAIRKDIVVPGFERSLSKIFNVVIDISEIKEAERKIRESEQKFRSIIENSIDGILLLDEQGIIREWNEGMTQLTNVKSKDAIGKIFWEVYRPFIPPHLTVYDNLDLLISNLRDVRTTGDAPWLNRPVDTEMFVDGDFKFVQLNIFTIKGENGFKIGVIWRDITQQKQIEKKMKQELLKFRIRDGSIYLVKEKNPILSIEVLKDVLRIGYNGLIVSRTLKKDYKTILDEDYQFLWLVETQLEQRFSSLFEKIIFTLKALPPKSVILFDRLDFLVSKYGFQETLNFIYKLRELVMMMGYIVIISIDEETITKQQMNLLEKETGEIETRILTEMTPDLLEILRCVYKDSLIGTQTSYTRVANELQISKPTVRKRIKQLVTTGYLQEKPVGRQKNLELTIKGFNFFKEE